MSDRLAGDITGWRGTGLILVVEDERPLCEVAREVLEAHGFTVLTATDGRQAVGIFREHAAEVRAVLLDLKLPEMTGEDVLWEIYRIRPEIPVILVTGVTEARVRPRLAGLPVAGFIQKPFYLAAFLRKVREVLESHGWEAESGEPLTEPVREAGEQRYAPRPLWLPVVGRAAQFDGKAFHGTVRRISADGLMAEFPVQFAPGTALDLVLQTGRGPLPVVGIVVRADPPGDRVHHWIGFLEPMGSHFVRKVFLTERPEGG